MAAGEVPRIGFIARKIKGKESLSAESGPKQCNVRAPSSDNDDDDDDGRMMTMRWRMMNAPRS